MRLVSINKLTEDMKLAKPVYQVDGSKILLNIGCSNLIKFKEKLYNMGIHFLYVEDELSKGIDIPDIIKNETRLESKKIVATTLKSISINKKINTEEIKKNVKNMIEDIINNKSIIFNLTDIRTNDSYTFSHSVNVTVIALLIGHALNYNEDNLMKLGIGALLHDIGKAIIPEEILNKPGKLTDEEFLIMQEHTNLGFDIVKSSWELSPLSKIVILSHHEKVDGTGYPRGLKQDDIHEFARIVSICDVFDALSSDRCYRPKWPTYQVIEYLSSLSGTQFDKRIIDKFIKYIAAFPNGSIVKLNDGKTGIVMEQNENFPNRPILKIILDEKGNKIDSYIINLMEELTYVIVDIE